MTDIEILRSQGLRIDAGIPDAVLNRCMQDAYAIAYKMVGAAAVAAIAAIDLEGAFAYIKTGQEGFRGLWAGVSYIAYALLLRDNVFASVYGTTNKRDDLSNQADPTDPARYWYALGADILHDVCRELVEVGLTDKDEFKAQDVPFIAEKAF